MEATESIWRKTDKAAPDLPFWQSAYQAHGPEILGFLGRRLKRREDAEDLLQDTFVRAIRSASCHDENPRAYLFRVAQNLLLNRHRRPRLVVPESESGLSARGDADASPFEAMESDRANPEEAARWRAAQAAFKTALGGLTESHRRAFELCVLDGRPYNEIASVTGWSLPQVKVNIHRARRRLLLELRDHLDHRDPSAVVKGEPHER